MLLVGLQCFEGMVAPHSCVNKIIVMQFLNVQIHVKCDLHP